MYWLVRLTSLASDTPGPDAGGVFFVFTLFFAAGPLVGLGLVAARCRAAVVHRNVPAPQG